ncbi:uncharacterized protein LOC143028875 [Oratosquilla oratoria]|uniref:uncharacterized protein LOC143028875 n=1 Tax=Oratosquilla oratoria TaxID=337810 RepID=UPI003F7679BE
MAMQRYEEEVMAAAPPSLKLWVRYVDDVFVVMQEEEVEHFFNFLNGRNEAIQFEMEKEKNGRLPFLDVMVTRVGSTLTTGVHRKATHTDRLLDYDSCHPVEHKRSMVKTLWSIPKKVCSTSESIRKEKSHLRKVFRDNGYPRSVVTKWTKAQENNRESERNRNTSRTTIPYVKGASEVTARLLRKHGVKAPHKPMNTLYGALTKAKDVESVASQMGMVYDVKCKKL